MDEFETFRQIMFRLLEENRMTIRDLARKMEDKKTVKPIKYSTLLNYNTEKTIPSFEAAKDILRTLGSQISDNEILEILAYSKRKQKEFNRNNKKEIVQGVRINPKYFGSNINYEMLDSAISERIADLFSTDEVQNFFSESRNGEIRGSLNLYINYLIYNDVKDYLSIYES